MELVDRAALRRMRKFRGYTMRTLAERVGCSHSTIGHLESGVMTRVREDYAKAIARHLDLPVEALFVVKTSTVKRDVPPRERVA